MQRGNNEMENAQSARAMHTHIKRCFVPSVIFQYNNTPQVCAQPLYQCDQARQLIVMKMNAKYSTPCRERVNIICGLFLVQ